MWRPDGRQYMRLPCNLKITFVRLDINDVDVWPFDCQSSSLLRGTNILNDAEVRELTATQLSVIFKHSNKQK